MADLKYLDTLQEVLLERGFPLNIVQSVLETVQTIDAVEVVRCRACVHAIEIEKDYIRKLFIDGTKQCDLGRGDQCFGYSIVSNDGFCDSGERRNNAAD